MFVCLRVCRHLCQLGSICRYKHHFGLEGRPDSSKEEAIADVKKHFTTHPRYGRLGRNPMFALCSACLITHHTLLLFSSQSLRRRGYSRLPQSQQRVCIVCFCRLVISQGCSFCILLTYLQLQKEIHHTCSPAWTLS